MEITKNVNSNWHDKREMGTGRQRLALLPNLRQSIDNTTTLMHIHQMAHNRKRRMVGNTWQNTHSYIFMMVIACGGGMRVWVVFVPVIFVCSISLPGKYRN